MRSLAADHPHMSNRGPSAEHSQEPRIAWLALRKVLTSAACFALLVAPLACEAATLQARYNPATGNITMQAVDGNGDPTTLGIKGFQFLSPTHQLDGNPVTFPTAPAGSGTYITTSNTDFGVFGVDSEIFAVASNQVALFDGSWDLGDVAAINMTQQDLVTNFTTDGDSTPGGSSVPGGYLYWVVGDAGYTLGTVVAVPEPTTMSLALLAACGLISRLHRTAGRTSVWRKSSPLKSSTSSAATAAA